MTAINPDAAKEAARRLVTRFVFDAMQSGASEAQILYSGRQIKTAYCLNGDWQRQDDMPVAIWPQILRRIRNMAFLTLGPQPPRQEGSSQWVINDEQKGEERHYAIGLVITHSDDHDDIRVSIPEPTRHRYKKPEGFTFVCGEQM